MMQSQEQALDSERRRQRLRLARLEADLAYFQARLEMIRHPDSANQLAQRKVFKALHEALAAKVMDIHRELERMRRGDPH